MKKLVIFCSILLSSSAFAVPKDVNTPMKGHFLNDELKISSSRDSGTKSSFYASEPTKPRITARPTNDFQKNTALFADAGAKAGKSVGEQAFVAAVVN